MKHTAAAEPLAARLFERHASAVLRYFRRHTGRADVAQELTQEVFLRVHRASSTYRHQDREAAWVFRIARHVLLDSVRARARERANGSADALESPVSASQDITVAVQRGLANLPDAERDAFLLAEVAGLSYAEIASVTDMTVAAVRSRVYRARLALREALAPPARIPSVTVNRGLDDD